MSVPYIRNPTYTDFKESVRLASTASIDLENPPTAIDGVDLVYGDNILLKDQGDATQNGIWKWGPEDAVLTRAPGGIDAQISSGMLVIVEEGVENADKLFMLTTDEPIEVDVTELVFEEFAPPADLSAYATTAYVDAGLAGKEDTLGFTPEDTANKGAVNGYAELDSAGKLPVSQLTTSAMEYKGVWDANTNAPALADGAGNTGDLYRVSVAGTQDLGSGNITFAVGDSVLYNGATWEKLDNTDSVTSVAGKTGVVTLVEADITDLGTYVDKTGDTMTGDLVMQNKKVEGTGYGDPLNVFWLTQQGTGWAAQRAGGQLQFGDSSIGPAHNIDISATGGIRFSSGSGAAADVQLSRIGANTLALGAGDKLQQNEAPTVGDDLVNKTYADSLGGGGFDSGEVVSAYLFSDWARLNAENIFGGGASSWTALTTGGSFAQWDATNKAFWIAQAGWYRFSYNFTFEMLCSVSGGSTNLHLRLARSGSELAGQEIHLTQVGANPRIHELSGSGVFQATSATFIPCDVYFAPIYGTGGTVTCTVKGLDGSFRPRSTAQLEYLGA